MTDLPAAIAALRAERDANASIGHEPVSWFLVDATLAAIDAARGQAVAWIDMEPDGTITSAPRLYSDGSGAEVPLYAAPPAALAVPDWLPQPDEVEYVGDAGPATDADFSVTEAQAELRLLRGTVKEMRDAVEAMRTAGGRVEFQAAFDAAKVLAAANKENNT